MLHKLTGGGGLTGGRATHPEARGALKQGGDFGHVRRLGIHIGGKDLGESV